MYRRMRSQSDTCGRRPLLGGLLILVGLSSLVGVANGAFCTPTSGTCWPSKSDITVWAKTLSNSSSVITPDKSQDIFLSEAVSMNLLKSNFPGLIVIPGTENDVRLAVKFATKKYIRIVARCSGHDFNGRSTGRGVMLIKTERLKSIVYDNVAKTVTFGSGCMHQDIYAALVPYNRLFVGGQSRTVCPAGCLAGGCHGLLSRRYGLGIDSVLEIRIVLYNGTLVTLNRTSHADLFHAYLGAGQNSFGVAVSFTARTYPAPPVILELNAAFSLVDPTVPPEEQGNVPNVLSSYFMNVDWFDSMPLDLAGNIMVFGDVVNIKFVYSGVDYDDVYNALTPLLTSPFTIDVSEIRNYTSMLEWAITNYPPDTEIWQRKFISNGLIPPNQDLLNAVSDIVVATKPYMFMWFVFGGAVHAGTTGAVPQGMRDAMYEVLFGTQWNDPHEDDGRMSYVGEFLPGLYQVAQASYNNEFTSWGNKYNNISDWKTRFYNDYEGLLEVKKAYDPCNLFTARYSVGWDTPAATCNCVDKPKK